MLIIASSFVPSYVENNAEGTSAQIQFITPQEVSDTPVSAAVTTPVMVYAFLPFLSMYHLHWLFALAVICTLTGIIRLISLKGKISTKRNSTVL